MRKYMTLFLAAAALLQGCMKDDLDGSACPDAQGTQIQLSIGNETVVETRSQVSTPDRKIYNAALLVFDSDDKYKTGEIVSLANITGTNGAQTRTLTTSLSIVDGDRVVMLANTDASDSDLSKFEVGTSTTDAINGVFELVYWKEMPVIGRLTIPMSGQMTFGTDKQLTLTRAAAKISVAYDSSIKTFADNNVWFLVYNKPTHLLPYSLNGAMSVPKDKEQGYEDTSSLKEVDSIGIDPLYIYTPECANASHAKTTTVAPDKWHRDRMCVILEVGKKTGNLAYYRIDLATGNGNDEKKNFLDIKRNHHYCIIIHKVHSLGYSTIAEALANPGSNLEYEVVITGDDDNFITSNGQYAVTTDKSEAVVKQSVSDAENLVKFYCKNNNFPADSIKTRKVSLLKKDQKTPVPTTDLQLCKSNGSPASSNTFDYTPNDDAGYQLKYTSSATLPSDTLYVEIRYGNIRHYVPVFKYINLDDYVFEVTSPAPFSYEGGTNQYKVTSYKKGTPNTAVAWTATAYYDATNKKWVEIDGSVSKLPAWVTTFTYSGTPAGTTATGYNATVAQATLTEGSSTHDAILKAAAEVGTYENPYDLSQGGETANCYIVNGPGYYSLPLVYGNARKADGTANEDAYITSAGDHKLAGFRRSDGNAITDPYIYNNGFTPTGAELKWQDEAQLITTDSLRLSADGKSLRFYVSRTNIKQGNAVVAVTGASGVLWSWHIWVTDYVLGSDDRPFVNYQNYTYTFMPINLGWCAPDGKPTSTWDKSSVKVRFTQDESGSTRVIDIVQPAGGTRVAAETGNSCYYQWGRKDPFVGDKPTTSTGDIGDPQTDQWETTNCVTSGILNPEKFNTYKYMDNTLYNLWSANNTTIGEPYDDNPVTKTVYDPSPAGYHMPEPNAFTGFVSNGTSVTGPPNYINGSCDGNIWTFSKGGNIVYFPMAAHREYTRGKVNFRGSGYYWTAVPHSEQGNGRYMHLNANWVSTVSSYPQAYAYSARPVKDVKE